MLLHHESFGAGQDIPVAACLRNRKLVKYFNRETAAFLVALHRMQARLPSPLAAETPFYYSCGKVEHEDYGLEALYRASIGSDGRFAVDGFVNQGMANVSPLTQFKVLYNMPLCFAAIEHGLTGDNAVLYGSVAALFDQALCAPSPMVLLGAGKVYSGGAVAVGCALVDRDELVASPYRYDTREAIAFFTEPSASHLETAP